MWEMFGFFFDMSPDVLAFEVRVFKSDFKLNNEY